MKVIKVKKADNAYDDFAEGLGTLLYSSDTKRLLTFMSDYELDLAEKQIQNAMKRIPVILKYIKEQRKNNEK